MLSVQSATNVRREFSRFVDGVVHGGPAIVRRNRDLFAAVSVEQLEIVVSSFRFHLDYEQENDGSYSGSLREIDVVGNAHTLQALKQSLAVDLVEYSNQYIEEFQLHYYAPNRRFHLPYVLHVLIQSTTEDVIKLIDADA